MKLTKFDPTRDLIMVTGKVWGPRGDFVSFPTETMRYVHVASAHKRPIPEEVIAAAKSEIDPDRRILLMLGGPGETVPNRGTEKNKEPGTFRIPDSFESDPTGT